MQLTRRNAVKTIGLGLVASATAGTAVASTSDKIKWDETFDVVVIGAGGAGMAAAIRAHDAGAKVVVFEKLPFAGGNTQIAQGFINAADPGRQKKQGIEDSPQKHFEQTLAAGDFRGDPERVRVLTENALGAVEWLESLGMKFKDNVIQIFGALYPRSHIPVMPKGQGYATVLMNALKERKVEVRTSTPLLEIIREKQFEGPVLGVKVRNKKGEEVYVRARRGVVLAAGGFSGNVYLRELHDPRVRDLGTDNLPGSTAGEVMIAANRVGAYLVGMDFIQSTPGAPKGKKLKIPLNFNVAASLYVDQRGKRIVDEGQRRDVIRDAVLGTPERYAFTFTDDETFQTYDKVSQATVHEGVKIGEAWTAPTLRELAVKMKVDPDALEATIARYNSFVDAKKDEDFGKAPHNLTHKFEKGPFWACYTSMTVHHTMGGVNTNVKAQCLDWTGAPIPHLYAAGEITGGIHGTNRVGGNAILDCFVFGQIAGVNVAKEKPL